MVHIVTGPPGAGKNTFVNAQMRPNDMIIDLDAIYAAISDSNPYVQKNAVLFQAAMSVRAHLFNYVRKYIKSGDVWIVACMPNGRKREMFARTFKNSKVYLIKPPKQESFPLPPAPTIIQVFIFNVPLCYIITEFESILSISLTLA